MTPTAGGLEANMCEARSPGGRLTCARPNCDGRGHVFIHASSAPDAKVDADSRIGD